MTTPTAQRALDSGDRDGRTVWCGHGVHVVRRPEADAGYGFPPMGARTQLDTR